MAKLGVDDDASCIITHAYQPCLLQQTVGYNFKLRLVMHTEQCRNSLQSPAQTGL